MFMLNCFRFPLDGGGGGTSFAVVALMNTWLYLRAKTASSEGREIVGSSAVSEVNRRRRCPRLTVTTRKLATVVSV